VLKLTPQNEISEVISHFEEDPPKVRLGLALMIEVLVQKDSQEEAIKASLLEKFEETLKKGGVMKMIECSNFLKSVSRIERIRKILLDLNFYSLFFRVVELYLHSPAFLTAPRVLLSTCKEIREQILQQNPSFVTSLETALLSPEISPVNQVSISGMLLILWTPSKSTAGKVFEKVKGHLFSAVEQDDSEVKSHALDCLMQAATDDYLRRLLLTMGAKELILPMAANGATSLGFLCCLILALLAAGDDNERGSLETDPAAISSVIKKMFDLVMGSETTIRTLAPFEATCSVLLTAIRSMATNEANLRTLKQKEVVNVMVQFFQKKRGGVLLVDSVNLEEVELSF